MGEYVHRLHLVVAAQDADRAGEIAARVLPGGDAERRMFGAPIGAAEGVSSGRLGCSTLLTEEQRRLLLGELEAAGIAAKWVQMQAGDEKAVAASAGIGIVAGRTWSWEETVGVAVGGGWDLWDR